MAHCSHVHTHDHSCELPSVPTNGPRMALEKKLSSDMLENDAAGPVQSYVKQECIELIIDLLVPCSSRVGREPDP